MTLHNYQREHIEQVLTDFQTYRSIMLQMPTGTGKTHVFCEIVKTFCNTHNKKVLILVHRKELIAQIEERVLSFGFRAGIIQSGLISNDKRQVQIASVQTLRRRDKITFISDVSLIIVDEAHHTPSDTYLEILKVYQKEQTKLLGVTATPIRLDGKGFERIFDKLICSYSFQWFINNKFLCPIKHFASDIIKLENISVVKNREGYKDYDEKQCENYYLNKTIMADIVSSYIRFGENKRSVVFAVSIRHAEEIKKRFIEAGFIAEVISSLTNSTERKINVENFRNGKIQILINVDVFTEGFDCPNIEVVQIVKPTKSLVKYLQMVGRVTRIFEGKKYGIILDNSCLWQDHGLVTNERDWSLNGCILKEEKFDNLIFSDGTSGSEAYKRKLKELFNIDMIEVGNSGIESDLLFTKQRLASIRSEYLLSYKQLQSDLNDIGVNIYDHLRGSSTEPDKRFISGWLCNFIDKKYCSNKSFKSIEF